MTEIYQPWSDQGILRIEQIDHVQITIPRGKEEAARQFYCVLLGITEIEKPETLQNRGGLWLQLGERQVHIGVEESGDREATKAHIAYRVTGINGWRKVLGENGVQILDGIPIPGADRFEFRDPFGNRVEFIERID